jgi:hypothetical protein
MLLGANLGKFNGNTNFKLPCLEPRVDLNQPYQICTRQSSPHFIATECVLPPLVYTNDGEPKTYFPEESFEEDEVSLKPSIPKVTKGISPQHLYGAWTAEEKQALYDGYMKLGKQWTLIAKMYVKTRSAIQVTSHGHVMIRKIRGGDWNVE